MSLDVFKCFQEAGQLNLPNILLNHYKELDISNDELIIIIQLKRFIDQGQSFPSIETLAEMMDEKPEDIYALIHSLIQKKLLKLDQSKNEAGQVQDSYSLDLLWEKLYVLLEQRQKKNEKVSQEENNLNLVQLFETEFGRNLSPFEIENIGKWLQEDHYSPELIKLALKEAVMSQVYNMKYIDRILLNWEAKHIKTEADVKREQKRYSNYQQARQKEASDQDQIKRKVPIFDWLNGDDKDSAKK